MSLPLGLWSYRMRPWKCATQFPGNLGLEYTVAEQHPELDIFPFTTWLNLYQWCHDANDSITIAKTNARSSIKAAGADKRRLRLQKKRKKKRRPLECPKASASYCFKRQAYLSLVCFEALVISVKSIRKVPQLLFLTHQWYFLLLSFKFECFNMF